RCYNPSDAEMLHAAVHSSLEQLRPWLPWIKTEPLTLDQRVQRLREFRGKFDLGQNYVFGIFSRDEGHLLGGTGYHPRIGPRALEIGYWVHSAHTRQGIATEAASALTHVGFELLKLARMEIRCDPDNLASAAVPLKLGYRHDATLRKCLVSATD